MPLTHPDRVLFRRPRITKQELAEFYRRMADFVLPGLVNRPLMLLRCPDGADGACFFQKHGGRGFPSAIHELNDRLEGQRWMYVKDLEGLMALVQMSSLEYHVWGTTIDDLERADRLVMDLDPGAGVRWKAVIEAALMLQARLADLGLRSFVRTSGGKGLHVVIPVRPAAAWDSAHQFARGLAEEMARGQPQRFLAVATRSRRRGRVFIDYLRNARGSTAVCSYSLRNRPGAPLAAPLTWDELPRLRAPDQFRFDNIARRLANLDADPWAGIERLTQSLPKLEQTGA